MKERFSLSLAEQARIAEKQTKQACQGPYGALHRGEGVLRVNMERFDPDKMIAVKLLGIGGKVLEQPPLFPEIKEAAIFIRV